MGTTHTFSWTRLLDGLVLLLPLLVTCLIGKVLPASITFYSSFQRYDLNRQVSPVGLENYQVMLKDEVLAQAAGQTVAVVAVRLFVSAVPPVALAYLLDKLGRLGRTFFRLCLTLIALLIVSVSLLQGWRILLDQRYGLLGKAALLADPGTALLSLLVIDGLTALAAACTVGTMVYMLVFRDANGNLRSAARPLLATWLVLGLLCIVGSQFVFAPSYVLTQGGPITKTNTWAYYMFVMFARYYRLGYASALYVPLLLTYLALILAIWGIGEWSGMRLVYVRNGEGTAKHKWLIALLLLPIVLAIALPILVPHLHSLKMVIAPPLPGLRAPAVPGTRFGKALTRSLMPLLPLTIIALPCAYLAALSISLIMPLGRAANSILFLLLLAGSAIPVPVLLPPLLDLFGTTVGLTLPYLASGVALYLFKLYFDGRREAVDEAVQAGKPPGRAILAHAVAPSLPILPLVLVVITFASIATGRLEWALMAGRMPGDAPAQVLVLQQMGSVPPVQNARYALQWTATIFLLWALPALPLQVWLVDRLALVCKPREA